MDKEIDILGAGPSLKNYNFPKRNACIFTNSLINHKAFIAHKHAIFVAHEPRLFSEQFIKVYSQVVKNKKAFIGGELAPLMSQAELDYENIDALISANLDAAQLFDILREQNEFLRNVVLDYAIPLSLALGFTKITLYGCDFNYGTKKHPQYSVKNLGLYEHSVGSAKKWSEHSAQKFRLIKNYLEKKGLSVCRKL
ncbi:hypothetical protein N9M02_01680 [Amylibacter sp.]|nr:hypothetical protein [Amylibacter sp.]